MNTIIINGNSYSGKNVVISNGKVIIDGNDLTPDSKSINIDVNGNINEINADFCNKIYVNGDVGVVKTKSGDVGVSGDVSGGIQTMSGDVDCRNVNGPINTITGNIKY